MTFKPRTNNVSLPDVKCRQIIICHITNENIDAGFGKIRPLLDIRPVFTWKNDSETSPVHSIDDTKPFGVAVGNKNANGEWIGHLSVSHDKTSNSAIFIWRFE